MSVDTAWLFFLTCGPARIQSRPAQNGGRGPSGAGAPSTSARAEEARHAWIPRRPRGDLSRAALPLRAVRASNDYRHRPGHLGRGAARRHRRSRQPGADREGADGRHRRDRPVPDREPAARHLQRHVHAARLQHRQARRAGADGHVRRYGQRRAEGRRARGDDYRHRRDADRRRPERATADGGRQRDHRRAADHGWLLLAPRARARHRRRHARRADRPVCLHVQRARRAPGGPCQRRGADDARRPAHLGAAGQLLELRRRHP